MMIEELLEEYLQSLQLASYSAHTIAAYKRDIQQWIDYTQLNQVDPFTTDKRDASFFLMDLARKGKDNSSIARKLSAIKNFFKFLQEREYITDNVFGLMHPPKRKGRLPQYLTHNQFSELVGLCTDDDFEGVRDRAILEVLYSTGCRAQELVDLNCREVKGRTEVLIRGKGNKSRVVFLVDIARKALERYYEKRRNIADAEEPALFLSSKGRRISRRSLYYLIRKYENKLSERTRLSVHLFRHTFATHLLDEGANLREVQDLLGHEQLSSTQIYTHVSVERLKSAYRDAHPHARRS
ncbi:tyrosine-type recombinase/integrase [Entomospira entomophila]|uniref:Tyrosine recombinase XerC n=1 Tax=Entomospira entomophila TaxID=2719988 RepID=A0A968GAV5_9SPIO|nr:site-specific tyrosine recombinase/integron integrase [Entomospira entomophilus]NIZ40990.1 tyrosine-type recombinase/integrase [Entomospira entomophilus]WDI35203.1 tyrosine-type recombinase/integrase [Entomospira entomophilus]